MLESIGTFLFYKLFCQISQFCVYKRGLIEILNSRYLRFPIRTPWDGKALAKDEASFWNFGSDRTCQGYPNVVYRVLNGAEAEAGMRPFYKRSLAFYTLSFAAQLGKKI